MDQIAALVAKIKNLFATGSLTRRDDDSIQTTTTYGRTVEGRESFPYGFAARAPEGTVLVLFEGGDVERPVILPTRAVDGIPVLEIGDSALWTKAGGWIVARNAGTVELFGTDEGGIPRAAELKAQLDKNSGILQALLSVVGGAPIPEPGNSSASAFQATLATAFQGKTPGVFDSIASEKVLHGTGAT